MRDFLRFSERVHHVSAALVFVQFGDFALVFDIDHILHRSEPCVGDLLLVGRADEAHVETGAAVHWGNVDDFDVVAVQVVAHKTCEQMLQRVDAFFGQDFFVGNAKAQVK